jgi:ankyrin repeat protein
LACENRDATIVKKLLDAGANARAALPSGETALMTAARTGSMEVLQLLIARGADVNAKEKSHGQTALMWAAAYDHPDVLKALLSADAATNIKSEERERSINTGFTVSERSFGNVEKVELGGYTALLFAARNGDVEQGKLLLDRGANVNDTASSGVSALALAAHSGNEPFALFLLEHGADPNAAAGGFTALHAAILRSQVALVKALIEKGADVNSKLVKGTATRYSSGDYHLNGTFVGATPYWLAAKYGELEIMRILAAHGADTKAESRDGSSPLMAAITAKNPSQLGLLLDRRDRMDTPTEYAARPAGQDEHVTLEASKIAIEQGSDPNLPNSTGTTPLVEAVTRGYESVVRLLVEKGADVNASTKAPAGGGGRNGYGATGGNTALHVAAQGGYTSIISYLVEKGAVVNAKNARGLTPLALARAKNRDGYIGVVVPDAQLKAAADLLVQLGATEVAKADEAMNKKEASK